MLEDRTIEVWSYNLETIIAEKFETIISRGTLGTRVRDYYDIYMLLKTQDNNIDKEVLKEAIKQTTKHRNSTEIINKWQDVVKILEESDTMKKQWERYKKDNFYAEGIEYYELIESIKEIGRLL